MKKLLGVSVLSASLVLTATPISYASTNDLPYVKEILALQPNVTENFINEHCLYLNTNKKIIVTF